MAAAASAQGIIATFDGTPLGKVTRYDITDGVIALDETDLSHERENNQAGIITISGSIDCLGDPEDVKGDVGNLVLSGTLAKDFGDCLCTEIGYGAQVKGTRTTRYTFVSSYET
jgi:hypothetical protein